MRLWLAFAGGVLVVDVLYWAQAVLLPFALAIPAHVRPDAARLVESCDCFAGILEMPGSV